eukprot:7156171-Prymnesium_polylepis.1
MVRTDPSGHKRGCGRRRAGRTSRNVAPRRVALAIGIVAQSWSRCAGHRDLGRDEEMPGMLFSARAVENCWGGGGQRTVKRIRQVNMRLPATPAPTPERRVR